MRFRDLSDTPRNRRNTRSLAEGKSLSPELDLDTPEGAKLRQHMVEKDVADLKRRWREEYPEEATGAGVVPTVLVASSDPTYGTSRPNVLSAADFVCDGTDDHVEINDAIAEAEATGLSGRTFLAEGYYWTAAPVIPDSDGGSIVGVGSTSALIASSGAFPLLDLDAHEYTVRDLYLGANSGGNWSSGADTLGVGACLRRDSANVRDVFTYSGDVGIYADGADFIIDGLHVYNPRQYGIFHNGTAGQCIITNCHIERAGWSFGTLNVGDTDFTATSAGICLSAGGRAVISDNFIMHSGNHGIFLLAGAYVSVTGNVVEPSTGVAIYVGSLCYGALVSGNVCTGDVTVDADNVVITGNFSDGALTVNGDNCVVSGNVFRSGITDNGVGNQVTGNSTA